MFSRLHNRLGTAGLVIAVIALVAALAGTAFAAAGLNSKQKKEVKKIAKQFAGKQGPAGPTGAVGAAGANGAGGPAGATGPTGAAGTNGATGPTGAKGAVGAAGADGATGATGATGVSGFTATLPSGETETGAWALRYSGEGASAISFNIPLAADISSGSIVYPGDTAPANCDDGTAPLPSVDNPEADPGNICLFVALFESGVGDVQPVKPETFTGGAGKTGAILIFVSPGADMGLGTFAVTAP